MLGLCWLISWVIVTLATHSAKNIFLGPGPQGEILKAWTLTAWILLGASWAYELSQQAFLWAGFRKKKNLFLFLWTGDFDIIKMNEWILNWRGKVSLLKVIKYRLFYLLASERFQFTPKFAISLAGAPPWIKISHCLTLCSNTMQIRSNLLA